MTRKAMLVLAAVIVLTVAGVFTAAAQTDTTPSPGAGMMGNGFGYGMMGADHDTMMAAIAESLGLEPAALIEKLHSGQTLAQIAEEQDVEVQAVYDAMLAHAKEHMDARVAAGTITQAEADEHLAWLTENITSMPMLAGGQMGAGMRHGAHHGHGMMGMMEGGRGMMGRGQGMGNGPRGQG